MTRDLGRLLRPRSIAVVGGGAWCRQIVVQSRRMGFAGPIHRVHPSPEAVEGVPAVPRLEDLPEAPDAVFLGINRRATVEAVGALSAMGAGGAVCFAAGFSEARAEDAGSADLQAALVAAAGGMPILGPNCYGFVNAVDGALLWPDQHGCRRVERGVAILTQSSNIAINLSMQRRGLPVAYVVTCGNMAQTRQAEIASALLDDPRVTAIGLHVEGFGEIADWHALALRAEARGVPLVVLKVGTSEQARRATLSHTASLAGSDAGSAALLDYLGMPRVQDLPTFLETLMLLHCNGSPRGTALSCISCSGGEASLAADMAAAHDLDLPPLTAAQRERLGAALGPMVALANPLDYHTYIWGDAARMAAAWEPMADPHIDLTVAILDYPHTDASAWDCATEAAIAVRRTTGRPLAVVSTLPELLPEDISDRLLAEGVTPLHGLREAFAALAVTARRRPPRDALLWRAAPDGAATMLSEAEAKALLARHGVPTPHGRVAAAGTLPEAVRDLRAPFALKRTGLAHKSDAGGVRLHLAHADLADAAREMGASEVLVEEMVSGGLCELLVGVLRDEAHGLLLTLGAGGVMTELWRDRVSMLMPVTREDVRLGLERLRIHPLLQGYRGAAPVNLDAVIDAVMAVQSCVAAVRERLYELEINPLICTRDAAIAADALILWLPVGMEAGDRDGADQDAP